MTDIEKMLAAGATPESIYREALKAVEAQNRAKVQAEKDAAAKKKVIDARKKMVAAFAGYMEAVTEEKVDMEHYATLEEQFAELETLVRQLKKVEKARAERPTPKKEMTDDEKLYRFLKELGAIE